MDWNEIPTRRAAPNFDNLLAVLQRKAPTRPTLFEFFLNQALYRRVVPEMQRSPGSPREQALLVLRAFQRLGYDYVTLMAPRFSLTEGVVERIRNESVSMNEGGVLHTRAGFDRMEWADPALADYEIFQTLAQELPPGMKFIVYGPGGVLENAVDLVGYDELCLMIHDDPALAEDIFAQIGTRLDEYYRRAARYDSVGACISNDDWGFKTQTMFSPRDMRRFVFPWHKKIVETIHAAGKPAILHSCGHFQRIIDDVIDDLRYDGRHSYEDAILPVEDFYEQYHSRIAVLGGIDLDFICRAAPEAIYQRSRAMLQRSAGRGSYALGTGNSVPEYVPDASYFAMLRAALEQD